MSSRLATFAILAALGGVSASACAIEVLSVLPPAEVKVKPGAATRLVLQVVVKPGYHVQANPVENPSLIPITLRMDAVEGVSLGAPHYPGAKRMRLAGDNQDLVVYGGTFVIAVPLDVGRDADAGVRLTLKGSLRYQACNDRHCLFPVTLPVAFAVTVARP